MGQAIRQLLVDCWNRDAIARPSFRTIIDRIRLMQTAPARSCPGETHLSLAPEAPKRLALRCCFHQISWSTRSTVFDGSPAGVTAASGACAGLQRRTASRRTGRRGRATSRPSPQPCALRPPARLPARPHRRPPSAIAAPNARSTTACPDRLGLVFVSRWAVLFADGSVAGGTLSTHIGYSKYSSHRSAWRSRTQLEGAADCVEPATRRTVAGWTRLSRG